MSEYAYAPVIGPGFTELSRSRQGRLFRKQILKFESFQHPTDPTTKLTVDEKFADTLIKNFSDGVCDIVQVPVVDGKNAHVEDPERNIGEVVDVQKDANGVYAIIDVRKDGEAEKMGKTYLGASAMLHLNYTDTRTGKKVGPTLLHTAVTNRPYITKLADYEEIVAASADTLGERPVVLTTEENEMPQTREELIAMLRDEHDVDVEALQAAATATAETPAYDESTLVRAFSAALQQAGSVGLSAKETQGEEVTLQDVAEAVVEVAQEKVELSQRVESLESELEGERASKTEREVDDLIKAGRVLPKAKDAMLKLARTDRETFLAVIPDEAIVSLSEDGVTTHSEPGHSGQLSEEQQKDIDRLSDIARGSK